MPPAADGLFDIGWLLPSPECCECGDCGPCGVVGGGGGPTRSCELKWGWSRGVNARLQMSKSKCLSVGYMGWTGYMAVAYNAA